ncbi:hypothetical protein C7212DRAFT_315363 [Tuber magnatum]|uniref:Mmc protein n=1 Tax=Tuber magnatum TaxID=42249 RepID=A0A317SU89_9PEZI|nr:hypothetical protein C7212DRAFT_315363 [Tuber magnatum]
MRFATIAAVFSVVAGASAGVVKNATEYTTTEVVTAYTTYCPMPTTIVENNKTYTVTKATTLTITNCPCTRTKVYSTILPTTVCPGKCSAPVGTAPVYTPPAGHTPVYPNVTVPTSKPAAPANTTKPAPTSTPFTGSANKATVAGAAMAGLIGAVAYLL